MEHAEHRQSNGENHDVRLAEMTLLMSDMYKNKRLNGAIIAVSCVAGLAFFLFIRQQTAISDGFVLTVLAGGHLSRPATSAPRRSLHG